MILLQESLLRGRGAGDDCPNPGGQGIQTRDDGCLRELQSATKELREDGMKMKLVSGIVASWIAVAGLGCSDSAAEREAKIRDEAAKAAAKVKPKVEEAGRDIRAAA